MEQNKHYQPRLFTEIEGEEPAHAQMRELLEQMHEEGKMTVDECALAFRDWMEGYYG